MIKVKTMSGIKAFDDLMQKRMRVFVVLYCFFRAVELFKMFEKFLNVSSRLYKKRSLAIEIDSLDRFRLGIDISVNGKISLADYSHEIRVPAVLVSMPRTNPRQFWLRSDSRSGIVARLKAS